MKAKRILQSALAVIMAAMMMMLLASCGAAEDVSAEGENRLTRAEEEAENAEVTAKEDTAKPTGEATGEEAKSATDETTTNAETSTDIKYFPDKTFVYDKYIIDAVTGEILLTTDEIYNYEDYQSLISFENNLIKFTSGYGNTRYVDANGSDVTSLITNGYEVFRDDSSNYGVKDKNGNIVIDAMYDSLEGYLDNTYFYFKLNDAYGVLNEKGEIIIKGLPYITDYIFYPENIVLYTNPLSLYSLSSGEFIGEYEQISAFDDKTFLVTSYYENDYPYAKIIDSNGNQIADLLRDSPVTADQISIIECPDLPYEYYKYFNSEIPLLKINLESKNGDWFYGLFNKKGEKIDGWIQVRQGGYGVAYMPSIIVTNTLRSDGNGWLFNVYDYSGEKLGSVEKANWINGKVFKEEDSNVFLRADGTKIGEFSAYSEYPFDDFNASNWSNAIIVTDIDGMFQGVIIGDELKYPCEYTSIQFINATINGYRQYPLLMLQKGSETIYITAESGAVVNLPQ